MIGLVDFINTKYKNICKHKTALSALYIAIVKFLTQKMVIFKKSQKT